MGFEFDDFRKKFQDHFATMVAGDQHLFVTNVDKDEMYNLYLDSFPEGTNQIVNKRREFECSACHHFIKDFGGVVTIENNVVHTIWEFDAESTTFQPVIDALDKYVKSKAVIDVYVAQFQEIGTDHNFIENREDGDIIRFNHLCVKVPARLVTKSYKSTPEIKNDYRTARNVFKRSLDELTDEAVDTVIELIEQNSIYRGPEWHNALVEFRNMKKKYAEVPDELKDNFAWEQSMHVGPSVSRIRNHSMGTLLVDISEGMELDAAVSRYEAIVAPENYKRPKAIFTKKMLEEAKATITELGYMPSLERRFATLDDITVNNVLFSNKDAAQRMAGANVFDKMEQTIAVDPKKFNRVQEMSIDDFISNVLPTTKSIDLLMESRHIPSLMSLIAPVNKDAPTMFKWNNGFSWAYSGNITDSSLRENVKAAGGKVDGVLRFSIQWNDTEGFDRNDLDAHCRTPVSHIFFSDKSCFRTGGQLDVDIINPDEGRPAVENITWDDLKLMKPGDYKFSVHCYTFRGGKSGFRAEIEFNGDIYQYDYTRPLRQSEEIDVAIVHYDGNGGFTIKELLPSNMSSREIWGVTTNQFVPVSVISYSPNYWDEQKGIGNRHYFFFMKDCVNSEKPNGFYNEFIKPELEKHKRVFEALGGQMAVQDTPDQLSGLGFSSSKRNNLLVRVTGTSERVIRINF